MGRRGATDGESATTGATSAEIWPIRRLYKGVHLTLNLEAASLLPVVLRSVEIVRLVLHSFRFGRSIIFFFLLCLVAD